MPSAHSADAADLDDSTVPVAVDDACETAEQLAVDSDAAPETAPGGLLAELERRQDDVLAQIDELDAKVTALLSELGVTMTPEPEEDLGAMHSASKAA